jgi:LPPG:FO 2-phospho-L-lactate transferase
VALKVVAFAGGVGGAKLAEGLYQILPPENLTVIVNTGDDFEHFGLHISPDIDTVVYTLAGLASQERGWGRAGESWHALDVIQQLGGPGWFRLGDKDIGLHLWRSSRLRDGERLSQVTSSICRSFGVRAQVLPMSDEAVRTMVDSSQGLLPFQEYFVARQCQPEVRGFTFEGVEFSSPSPGVLAAIHSADAIVFCPSNPWVSLDPILAVKGIKEALQDKLVLAVSPIIRGQALKGPAAKMYRELGFEPAAHTVAQHYQDILTGFVFDEDDSEEKEVIAELGMVPRALPTVMTNQAERMALARQVLAFAADLRIEAA